MLEQSFFGNTLYDWGISIIIILGALVVNKIIILLNKYVIKKITDKTDNRLDDILFEMLEAPVLLGILLFAIWIAAKRLNLGPELENVIAKSFRVLIVVNITWFASRLVNALIEEFLVPQAADQQDHLHLDRHLLSIIRRTALAVIWSIGLVMALNNVGVDVATLIAGLGIGGLAFALAAQDTIKNIFGGFTIFTDRPFRIGDRIKVAGFDGFVEDIGIRSTRIRTLEKRSVTIPNYKIVDAAIENVSGETKHRILTKLSLNYNTSPEKMNEALSILKGIPNVVKGVESKDLLAVFTDFSEYSLVITFIYYLDKQAHVMEVPSQVNFEVLRAFIASGIEFALPTHTILMEGSVVRS